jgi:hypothetical protein
MFGDEWHEALLQNKGRNGASGINAPQAELGSEVISPLQKYTSVNLEHFHFREKIRKTLVKRDS